MAEQEEKKTQVQASQGGFEGRRRKVPQDGFEGRYKQIPPLVKEAKETLERPPACELLEYMRAILGALDQKLSLEQNQLSVLVDIKNNLIATSPTGTYFDTGQASITVATATQPNSPDTIAGTTGYDSQNIYATVGRVAHHVFVINDGPDSLYVISSIDGKTWSNEALIRYGEARTFYAVWELRLRSPTAGNSYRVTEFDYWLAYSSSIAVGGATAKEMAVLHNQAYVAGADMLAAALTPVNTPTTFRIQVAMSAAGNFTGAITRAGNTQVVTFNVVPGPALVAGGLYIFDLLVHSGDTVNFRYSVNATIQVLRVQEIDQAS